MAEKDMLIKKQSDDSEFASHVAGPPVKITKSN